MVKNKYNTKPHTMYSLLLYLVTVYLRLWNFSFCYFHYGIQEKSICTASLEIKRNLFYAFVDFDTYSKGTNVSYGSASLNN